MSAGKIQKRTWTSRGPTGHRVKHVAWGYTLQVNGTQQRCFAALGLGLLLSGLLVAPNGAVYDAEGVRRGYLRESAPGQFDLYDNHSRRFGYGRQGRDGTIELYDTHSRRILTIKPGRPGAWAMNRGRTR